MAATRHDRIIVTSGDGSGASATIGAMIVIALAVTLQMPNTIPMNRLGKYYIVVIYNMAKQALAPNLAESTAKGISSVMDLSSNTHRHISVPLISVSFYSILCNKILIPEKLI